MKKDFPFIETIVNYSNQEEKKGYLYWLYKYLTLSFLIFLGQTQHWDSRFMYKMFLKGYYLDWNNLNTPW